MATLNDHHFHEELLRTYLGRYESQFKVANTYESQAILITDSLPVLIIYQYDLCISLSELIKIEQDDPYFGAFDHYQRNIFLVALHDPYGFEKMEEAISKSLIAGPKS